MASKLVNRCIAVAAAGLLLPVSVTVHAQETAGPADAQQTAPGVNPKDNITKAEVIIQYNNLEGGFDAATLAFKYDLAFNSNWGANVELPVTHFSGPGLNATDIGDLNLRARNVQTSGRISLLSAVELVVPTAGSEFTGTGRWQINPVVGAVYAFDQQTFAFAGYKHYFSFAGEDSRDEINRSEVRALLARLFANATWTLADLKYTSSHTGAEPQTLDFEIEYGSMISSSTALSGRIGTSFLDSNRDFGFSINIRRIF